MLKELSKHIDEDWNDYQFIQDAIQGIDKVVRDANETKRVMDNELMIQHIRNNIDIVCIKLLYTN